MGDCCVEEALNIEQEKKVPDKISEKESRETSSEK
uniref:Uncharacterized protein n=1 Tax=Trichinella nativa TaxID=6335 RepID=A0A0V1J0A7_9BILA